MGDNIDLYGNGAAYDDIDDDCGGATGDKSTTAMTRWATIVTARQATKLTTMATARRDTTTTTMTTDADVDDDDD